MPHLSSKAKRPETPKKPVTNTSPPAMWSLGYALFGSSEEARMFQRYFDASRYGPDALRATVLLARRWQQSVSYHDDDVIAPWAIALHHQLADQLEHHDAPGKTIVVSTGRRTCPTTIQLPCRGCGHPFQSAYRGGRFGRLCGRCFEGHPIPPAHPRGGLTVYKRGVLPRRRRGQTLGVTQFSQSVLCDHPDCLALFVATKTNRQRCDAHLSVPRESLRRKRQTEQTPKRERFLFTPVSANRVQFHWGPLAEEVCIRAGEMHQARDESELHQLALLVAYGQLRAVRS